MCVRLCACAGVCVHDTLALVQANQIRQRKKEFLRLQKQAINAGVLPKDHAIAPSALDVPTTAVTGRYLWKSF